MAYATVDELAAALHVRIGAPPNDAVTLQACLDAAALEIDHAVDRTDPIPDQDPLANRVNLLRAVEWFKANDAAFGVVGAVDSGTLAAPRSGMRRHTATLLPLVQGYGIG